MQQYHLSEQALSLWLNYVERQVGFILPKSQNNWVKVIIERHMRRNALDSTALLQTIVQDATIYHQLIDDILIPRTQFFRHLPTFAFAEAVANAWHLQPQNQQRSFTAWSVGCSTGQEAVTIALCLENASDGMQVYQVFGSDFHQQSLIDATLGEYDNAQKPFIPALYHHYLKDVGRDKFAPVPTIKSQLQFFSKNLVDAKQSIPLETGQCQLIVCNNVLIYFWQFEQRDIVRYLARYLADDGVLLLGSGENLGFSDPDLQQIAVPTINGYCKTVAPDWLKAVANIER